VGGASCVYEAMTGLGLPAAPDQARFDLSGRVSAVRVLERVRDRAAACLPYGAAR